jgi:hypothetical protein
MIQERTFNQTGAGEATGLLCAKLARQHAQIETGFQEIAWHLQWSGAARSAH